MKIASLTNQRTANINRNVELILKFCRNCGLLPINIWPSLQPSVKWSIYTLTLLITYIILSLTSIWVEFLKIKNLITGTEMFSFSEELLIISTEWFRLFYGILTVNLICKSVTILTKISDGNKTSIKFYWLQFGIVFVILLFRIIVLIFVDSNKNVFLQVSLLLADSFRLCGTLQIFNFVHLIGEKVSYVNFKLDQLIKAVLKNKYVSYFLFYQLFVVGKLNYGFEYLRPDEQSRSSSVRYSIIYCSRYCVRFCEDQHFITVDNDTIFCCFFITL